MCAPTVPVSFLTLSVRTFAQLLVTLVSVSLTQAKYKNLWVQRDFVLFLFLSFIFGLSLAFTS